MSKNYQKLENLFTELYHLQHFEALGNWDEATMMPTGAGEARAKALSTLCGLIHKKLSTPQVTDLIEEAKVESLSPWQQANLQWIEKRHQQATCLPQALVKTIKEKSIMCEQAWRQAYHDNNWRGFSPKLNEVFNLVQEAAQLRSQQKQMSPYDVLLDDYCPDFNQKNIDPIFNELKQKLPSLIDKITQQQQKISTVSLKGPFAIAKQKALGTTVMQQLGFNFNHGRLDISHHPFCGGVPEDVRITTRYNDEEFLSSLSGICHETGHACYEQGLPKEWLSQPVGQALGMAVHESQSLFIEMAVCRSLEFMSNLVPEIKKQFSGQSAFTASNLFNLTTQVKKSYIRVNADEVTYPLHVILRYELEKELFNQKITVNDLQEAWNSKMEEYFGLSTLTNDTQGVLQDVHWPSGAFGYFPAYTLGRLIAAQLYNALLSTHPNIPDQIKEGNFSTLLSWLRQNVHRKASSVSTTQLLKEATGHPLSAQYFIHAVQARYLTST